MGCELGRGDGGGGRGWAARACNVRLAVSHCASRGDAAQTSAARLVGRHQGPTPRGLCSGGNRWAARLPSTRSLQAAAGSRRWRAGRGAWGWGEDFPGAAKQPQRAWRAAGPASAPGHRAARTGALRSCALPAALSRGKRQAVVASTADLPPRSSRIDEKERTCRHDRHARRRLLPRRQAHGGRRGGFRQSQHGHVVGRLRQEVV